jgi:hypothetical protein
MIAAIFPLVGVAFVAIGLAVHESTRDSRLAAPAAALAALAGAAVLAIAIGEMARLW